MVGRHRTLEDRRRMRVHQEDLPVFPATNQGAGVEDGNVEKLLSSTDRYLICKVRAVECGECVECQVSCVS